MSQSVPVRLLFAAALLAAATGPSLAAEPMPGQPGGPPVDPGPPPNMDCAGEPVTGSGPGFSSSRDESEEAAIAGWVEKAQTIYPEATWDNAYKANMSCAVQGLYSKCFAQAFPCKPKDGEAAVAPPGEAPVESPGDSAQAPE